MISFECFPRSLVQPCTSLFKARKRVHLMISRAAKKAMAAKKMAECRFEKRSLFR